MDTTAKEYLKGQSSRYADVGLYITILETENLMTDFATLKTEEKDKTIAELKEQLRQTNEAVGKLTDKILNLEI